MQRLLMMAVVAAFALSAPAMAQHPSVAKGPPAEPSPPPPPADVRPPLCVYHNIYYSKGATICIGTGWAQVCQPDGGWTKILADPRSFSNACGDAKSVPPS
jgi:hypothetical protein